MKSRSSLDRTLWRYGVVMAICLAFMVPLSYLVAPFISREGRNPGETVQLYRLSRALPIPATARLVLDDWFDGRSILRHRTTRSVAYISPLVIAGIAFVLAVRLLLTHPEAITPDTTNLLFRLSVALALIGILTYPMFVQDFWLSAAWGRMIVQGQNPWYQTFSDDALRGIPVRDVGYLMTYGPLWSYLSALTSWMGGASVGAVFLLGKGLLAGFWILTLGLIRRIAREQFSEADAAIAVCIFGWMPMSIGYSVQEGHNDVVMVAGLTMWLYLVSRRRHLLSPLALTASFLIKYVTAPLAILDLMSAWRSRVSMGRYLAVGIGCVLGAMLLFFPFFRGMDMFAEVREMQNWRWWTPDLFIRHLGWHVGTGRLPVRPVQYVVMAVLLVILLWSVWRWWRDNSFHSFVTVVLAFLTLSLFSLVGHVWPWFAMWLLPAAALTWRTHLGRAALAFCFMVPVLNQAWFLRNQWEDLRSALSIVLYGGTAALFAILTMWTPIRRSWRSDVRAADLTPDSR